MSGGTAVQTESHGGVRAQPQASHGHGFRPYKATGLVLTEDGPARPQKKRRSVSRSRLAIDAQGMEAAGPRLQARFTTARPRRGALTKNTLLSL